MRTITVDNFTFKCEYVSKKCGFKHTCSLYVDGCYLAESSAHYLNRTWEMYTYQTVMVNTIYNYMSIFEEDITTKYKTDNNKKRLSKTDKEILETLFSENPKIIEAREILNKIKTNYY